MPTSPITTGDLIRQRRKDGEAGRVVAVHPTRHGNQYEVRLSSGHREYWMQGGVERIAKADKVVSSRQKIEVEFADIGSIVGGRVRVSLPAPPEGW